MLGDLDRISFQNDTNSFRIEIVKDHDCSKSNPCLRQQVAEEMVQTIHKKMKKYSAYASTSLFLSPVDYYDAGDCAYLVAGASIKRGHRKSTNDSWSKTAIPKGWELQVRIIFIPSTRFSNLVTSILELFNIKGASATAIVKKMKSNQACIEFEPQYVARGRYSERSGSYEVVQC